MSKKNSPTNKQNELNELFIELKQEYLDSFDEKIESIMTFWHRRDRKNLQNEFHKIKGTGTTYGVHEATHIAEILEDLCARNSSQLGVSIMMAIEAFRHIRHQHRNGETLDLDKQRFFRVLQHFQKGSKSA
jgi:chemotaxis protein histidine kinase CheA